MLSAHSIHRMREKRGERGEREEEEGQSGLLCVQPLSFSLNQKPKEKKAREGKGEDTRKARGRKKKVETKSLLPSFEKALGR